MKILDQAAHGLTYKEIGAQLGITERTIKYHMGEIVERLHVNNRAEAIRSARQSGLIPD
jgi:two-component system NarL family response regulator